MNTLLHSAVAALREWTIRGITLYCQAIHFTMVLSAPPRHRPTRTGAASTARPCCLLRASWEMRRTVSQRKTTAPLSGPTSSTQASVIKYVSVLHRKESRIASVFSIECLDVPPRLFNVVCREQYVLKRRSHVGIDTQRRRATIHKA